MTTIIFGGRQGDMFQDYLYNLRRAIAVQLEKQLESESTETIAKQEIKKMFLIDKIHFDIDKGEISDTGADRYENVQIGGAIRRAFMKRFSYTIPFTGDSTVIKFRPQTFHGSDRTADISSNYSTKQNQLTVSFRSELNNQSQLDHNKFDSLGDISENCSEINSEIETWNNKQLDEAITEIYPKVLAHINETKDFEKRNNIKKI